MAETAQATTVPEALQQVVQKARTRRHLSRGLNESARSLEQRKAVLCVLSSACSEENYTKLMQALCNEHQIPLMKVDDSELLGTWAGLAKYDEEGNPRKIVKCACVVVQQWDGADEATMTIQNYIKITCVELDLQTRKLLTNILRDTPILLLEETTDNSTRK